MGVPASLLPELEDVVQHGSAEKRAETLRRITTLVPRRRSQLQRRTRRAVRRRHRLPDRGDRGQGARLNSPAGIAPVANAPAGVVSALAKNDDIAVAGPVLKQARLADPDLMHIAENKSQAHSARDVDAPRDRRGAVRYFGRTRRPRGCAFDRQQSSCAALRTNAFTTLVKRAEQDGVAGRKGRHAHRHSATALSAASDAGERSRAKASACKSEA